MKTFRIMALTGALVALVGCASSMDRAASACAAYGLAGDPQCIAMVAETRKQAASTRALLIANSPSFAPTRQLQCTTVPGLTGSPYARAQAVPVTVCQ